MMTSHRERSTRSISAERWRRVRPACLPSQLVNLSFKIATGDGALPQSRQKGFLSSRRDLSDHELVADVAVGFLSDGRIVGDEHNLVGAGEGRESRRVNVAQQGSVRPPRSSSLPLPNLRISWASGMIN